MFFKVLKTTPPIRWPCKEGQGLKSQRVYTKFSDISAGLSEAVSGVITRDAIVPAEGNRLRHAKTLQKKGLGTIDLVPDPYIKGQL